ncbi:MAG: 50S ribosomal protein L23, large subunit ribosomal protein L23 [archaeon GW2011_AR19]|nr:MAG: 50S ribosomal protein L23, large subunit ribosomal protein L23 [archaeon GW2011_AR19]
MNLKIISTEKAVMKIEAENVLTFETDKEKTKEEIKKEVEESLGVKVDKIRTFIRGNKKIIYAKLNKNNLAIDVATKIGVI